MNRLDARSSYFGAVCLRDGKFVYRRETEKFNAESSFKFIKQLRKMSCHSGNKVIVISDNARYHHAKLYQQYRENCADRFELDYLPSYSPELNPIERVWKLTRRCCTHNVYFPTRESIRSAVASKSNEWTGGINILTFYQSICWVKG